MNTKQPRYRCLCMALGATSLAAAAAAGPCGPGNGDCCIANGSPGCEDVECCNIVCDLDPYCCDTTWDILCAAEAADLCAICGGSPCGPGNGDCCIANGSPGCEDVECCNIVCDLDPFCCDITWDGLCADDAADLCAICGGPPCPWDCGDGDGSVDIDDFLALIAQWGTEGTCDFDGGGVDIDDFLKLIANWGPCP